MKSIFDAKAVLRKEHLRRLRMMAKNNPTLLHKESTMVCRLLYERIQALRSGRTVPASLLLCAYLPLYYELDVQPLLRRLWQEPRDECLSAFSIFVPMVLTPLEELNGSVSVSIPPWWRPWETAATRLASAMMFVEVFSEEDLHTSFEKRGRYQLMEPKDNVVQQIFLTDVRSECYQGNSLRRCIVCDDFDVLFPECRKPQNLIELRKASRTAGESICLVVLVPGVLFDRVGGRLGKGGGYYDRFLQYNWMCAADAVVTWGVSMEMQMMAEGFTLPVCRHDPSGNGIQDFTLDAVVTPTGFVRCAQPA